MKSPKLLYFLWVVALSAVVMMSVNASSLTTDFQGIADTSEVIVNSENGVEIKKFHVIPGQEVKTGDLLVELGRPELIMKINEIAHDLERYKNRRVLNLEENKSRIRQLKAQKASVISEIDYKIKQLRSRHDFNKTLTRKLKSLQPPDPSDGQDSVGGLIALEIEGLKKERELSLKQIAIEMESLRAEQKSPESPVTIRMQSLKEELNMLEQEKNKLLIYAKLNGVIGSVHFKPGEKVSPFVPILTLYTKTPSYVKGYIHENIYNQISLGDRVDVVSIAGNNCCTQGEVVGVGSRIVEYPQRLRKRAEIQMWGREVQIRIFEDNSLLLGERVMVRSMEKRHLSYLARLKDFCLQGRSYAYVKKMFMAQL